MTRRTGNFALDDCSADSAWAAGDGVAGDAAEDFAGLGFDCGLAGAVTDKVARIKAQAHTQ